MKKNEILEKYSISEATLRNWKKLGYIDNLDNIESETIEGILSGKKDNRRNKRTSNKNVIPVTYVEDKKVISIIEKIFEIKNTYRASNKEILHETVLHILNNKSCPKEVENVLGQRSVKKEFLHAFTEIDFSYDNNNDLLGCLWTSLLTSGEKDKKGVFYTPYKIAKNIVDNIELKGRIVDPACGSGNFLIQAFKKLKNKGLKSDEILNNLYGFDIDEVAVLLAKINLYILDDIDFNSIKIECKDFLCSNLENFDTVIGNPPWGIKYTKEEKKKLEELYDLEFSKMDSFAQFIKRSFSLLNENGKLSFVLPESVLNIETHESIRKFLMNYEINEIKTYGKEFEEVVTDVVVITATKNKNDDAVCSYNGQKIKQKDFLKNHYCSFLILNPLSKSIIKKIKNYPHFNLTDNVEYALGIVTGDNASMLLDEQISGSEPVLSGKEITRYIQTGEAKKFIVYNRSKMQQVAKDELYRNTNKIIYKFIGKKLCFAAETNGLLTLNSANVISLGKEYNPYYISAILNSRITQLYFEDNYNTHKVLKNHIQSFCIPRFSKEIEDKITTIVKNIKDKDAYNEDIENLIYTELKLTKKEIDFLITRWK